jgi:hypothetical protein
VHPYVQTVHLAYVHYCGTATRCMITPLQCFLQWGNTAKAGRSGSCLPAASWERAGGVRSTPFRAFSTRIIGVNRKCFIKPASGFPVPFDEGLGVYGRFLLRNCTAGSVGRVGRSLKNFLGYVQKITSLTPPWRRCGKVRGAVCYRCRRAGPKQLPTLGFRQGSTDETDETDVDAWRPDKDTHPSQIRRW